MAVHRLGDFSFGWLCNDLLLESLYHHNDEGKELPCHVFFSFLAFFLVNVYSLGCPPFSFIVLFVIEPELVWFCSTLG
jgi:hypothetical protein